MNMPKTVHDAVVEIVLHTAWLHLQIVNEKNHAVRLILEDEQSAWLADCLEALGI